MISLDKLAPGSRQQGAGSRQQPAVSRQQTADIRQLTVDSRQHFGPRQIRRHFEKQESTPETFIEHG
jgi:hypothetical protein